MDSNKKRKLDDTSNKEDELSSQNHNNSVLDKQKIEKTRRLKEVKIILDKKKRINSVIYSLERNMQVLKEEIRDLDNKLYSVCPHEWVRDWESFEPCGPTPKICKYCQL